MKYPVSHTSKFEEIEKVVSTWRIEKDFDHVLKWLMQFDTEDIDLGVRIIKNMNVIGFDELNRSLTIAYSKLERVAIDKKSKITASNTLFAGIGDGAKSGGMIGYNFRVANELSEENFLTDESMEHLKNGRIDNIVLVDDVIGTGDQASKEIKTLTEKVLPLGVNNIFLLTAVGMTDGIKKIVEVTKAHVFSAFEYTSLDTAANLDSTFYEGVPHENREKLRARLEYYCKPLGNPSDPALGYGGIGALIAFFYNTPNISLPVIWGSKNSWIPLFKRAVKIHGISSYYAKIDGSVKAREREQKQGTSEVSNTTEVIIYVEGRLDEIFFEFLIEAFDTELPMKISIVSLGGTGSASLLTKLALTTPKCIFVVEEEKEESLRRRERRDIRLKGVPPERRFMMQPAEYYFDSHRIFTDERWARFRPQFEAAEPAELENSLRREVREILLRLIMRPLSQRQFLESFVDSAKVTVLRRSLKQAILTL